MKKNVGNADKWIRIGVVAASVVLAAYGVFPWLIACLVAVIALVTGLTGYCPLYGVCGISTRRQTGKGAE
ncbi:MAG TPA: DUF2892 domain-containing protein [Bacteroidota bacterium]|nr:DUF2892 domain-containing protein [Bacteroidota bacterium]